MKGRRSVSPSTLVYRVGSLGDTLVSMPAMAAIRRLYPNDRLVLLTASHPDDSGRVSPWSILKETGWFEDVIFYDPHRVSLRERWRALAHGLRVRRRGFDRVFSLAPPRSSTQLLRDACVFRALIGARHYHAGVRADNPSRHRGVRLPRVEREGLRLLRIVDPNAGAEALDSFRLSIPAFEQADSRRLLSELGVKPGQVWLGIGPGSGRPATTWPAERYGALGRALLERFKDVVLLAIGGQQDRALCDQLCAGWGPRAHNLAGHLSVYGSAAVLSRCVTFVGNDSGPMHLAAMVGTPIVAVFSARNSPGQWEPFGTGHIALREQTECAGCLLEDCVHEAKKCLTRIQPESVLAAAITLIESHRRVAAGQRDPTVPYLVSSRLG